MTDLNASVEIMRITADIVAAYLRNQDIPADDLPPFIRRIRLALTEEIDLLSESGRGATPFKPERLHTGDGKPDSDRSASAAKKLEPPVPIEDSISHEFIISLEDGKPYRSLKRHLNQKFGLSPDQYRAKWNLPPDYPMVAPGYAEQRSRIALQIGLGHKAPDTGRKQVGASTPAARSRSRA